MGFGGYLKRVRKSKGMTVNQLAMYADISAATISRIERGKRGTPKPTTIKKLSAALKYSYEDMMKEAGYMPGGSEEQFVGDMGDLELTHEDIVDKYNVTVDGKSLTPEQIKLLVKIVRADRME